MGGSYDDVANGIAIDGSGNSYVTGFFEETSMTFDTITITGSGNSEIFIVKYDAAGNALWARSIGGNMIDAGNSIASDSNGNSYVTGAFQSDSITFGSTTLTNAGIYDIFVAKYDPLGNVSWAKSVGGTNSDAARDICVDNLGNAYVTGSFQSPSITFGSMTLTNTGVVDIFVAKLSSSVGIEEHLTNEDFNVYPNPVSDNLTVETSAYTPEGNCLSIYTLIGEKIMEEKFSSQNYSVDVSQLSEGIYIIEVKTKKNIIRAKFVKE